MLAKARFYRNTLRVFFPEDRQNQKYCLCNPLPLPKTLLGPMAQRFSIGSKNLLEHFFLNAQRTTVPQQTICSVQFRLFAIA